MPQALALFSFKDCAGGNVCDELFENATLRKHAAKVVGTVDKAVGSLKKLDKLIPVLVNLGKKHVGYGVEPAHWWARGSGKDMEFGPGLKPLEPLNEELVFLRGLFNEQSVKNSSAHLGRMPNLLSGAWVSLDVNDLRVGKTMDQVLVEHLGHHTVVPRLVLGIEPTELRLEDGLSMIYGSCISWASATRPATKEISPSRTFDLLIGDRKGRRRDRSVLDQVLQDARHLQRRVGVGDQRKLDEHEADPEHDEVESERPLVLVRQPALAEKVDGRQDEEDRQHPRLGQRAQ